MTPLSHLYDWWATTKECMAEKGESMGGIRWDTDWAGGRWRSKIPAATTRIYLARIVYKLGSRFLGQVPQLLIMMTYFLFGTKVL